MEPTSVAAYVKNCSVKHGILGFTLNLTTYSGYLSERTRVCQEVDQGVEKCLFNFSDLHLTVKYATCPDFLCTSAECTAILY